MLSSVMQMLAALKTLILDFQETALDTGVARRLRLKAIHGKAAVCIGVRRSEKSTYLFVTVYHDFDRQRYRRRDERFTLTAGAAVLLFK